MPEATDMDESFLPSAAKERKETPLFDGHRHPTGRNPIRDFCKGAKQKGYDKRMGQLSNRSQNGLSLRKKVQMGFFLLTIGIGIQFLSYVHHMERGDVHVIERPSGVDGFLPIGAIMGFKHLVLSGEWDTMHPAAMVILGYAALISFFFRKSFCGWVCPVGTLSEWLATAGNTFFKKSFRMPRGIALLIGSVKYTVLAFFLYVIFNMEESDIRQFLFSPYYQLADVKMLHFFTRISSLSALVLWILVLCSLFFRNFWCRYLCPYGALMSFFSIFSPSRIIRNKERCIACRKCDAICPYHIPVSEKETIAGHRCSGCMDCVGICPPADTLSFELTYPARRRLSKGSVAAFIITGFLFIVFLAKVTGCWKSHLSPEEFAIHLKSIDAPFMRHP